MMEHIEAIDMAEADANAEDRPIVAAQQDGGLVAELLAIDEAAMYERPATTRATIERAATVLAEQAARIADLEADAGLECAIAAFERRCIAEGGYLPAIATLLRIHADEMADKYPDDTNGGRTP